MEDILDMTYTVPTDSLGRQVGLFKNFSRCSDDFLLKIKNSMSLSMELAQLKLCRDSYLKNRRSDINLSTLYLFDEIVKAAKMLAQNQTIENLFFSDRDMFDTYKDLFEKHSLLCGEKISPLSLGSAAAVGSKYMSMIGLPTKERVEPSSFLPENTVFSIVLPSVDISPEEYDLLVKQLIFDDEIADRILRLKRIDCRGIAYTLSDMALGISADISSIFSIPQPHELSYLATECHSKYILATNKEDISVVSAAAEELGLTVLCFAKALSVPVFSISPRAHISLSTDINLIRELGHSLFPQSIELSLDCKKNFIDAINEAIDALLPILAQGANLQDIVLSANYGVSIYANKAPLGSYLASILGVYRIVCELCVPNTCKVRYSSNEDLSLSVSAYNKNGHSALSSCFSRPFSGVYLLSFNYTENALPDFESLRGMCSFIGELNTSGAIISARAIHTSISETLDAMQATCKIALEPNAAEILSSDMKGIIVESAIPLKTGILLGSVMQN